MENAFTGQAKRPTEKQLAAALGKVYVLWQDLVAHLKHDLELDGAEWTSYSVKAGWSLRLQRKKRNIVYLAPGKKCMSAALVLGDKALAAARASKLSPSTLNLIDNAKRYPEGTAVRMEVRGQEDCAALIALAKIKLAN